MTVTQDGNRTSTRQLFSLAYFWSILRAPETFVFSLILLAGVIALAGLIPQQPTSLTDDGYAQWVDTIPNPFRQLATALDTAGLFRIFDTVWFWFPAAFLVLLCLIILADYTPLIGRHLRGRSSPSRPTQAHPFHEQTAIAHQVPSPSDAGKSAAASSPLQQVQQTLSAAGFRTHLNEDGPFLTASRHHRRWAGPIILTAGLILIVAGLIVQTLWGASQESSISIKRGLPGFFATQPVRVKSFQPKRGAFNRLAGGIVILDIGQQSNLTWRLHQPYEQNGWWFVPAGIYPSAEITLAQASSPPETIALRFPSARKAAYFSSPAEGLLFRLTYILTDAGPDYELALVDSPAHSEGRADVLRDGPQFFVPAYDLSGTISMDEWLQLRAYRLPVMAVVLVLAGLVVVLFGLIWLSLNPPTTIWLTLITRGRGSRIEGESVSSRTAPPRLNRPETLISLPDPEAHRD